MSEKPPLFEARDLSGPVYTDKKGEKHYVGPERRKANRRGQRERRDAVRFEDHQEHPDRRDSLGRRKDDKAAPKFW